MVIRNQQTEHFHMAKWLLLKVINCYYINTVAIYIVCISLIN